MFQVVQLSPLSAVTGECYFGRGFLKTLSISGYSSVSQASSFHWLGPAGAPVIRSPHNARHLCYFILFISRHIKNTAAGEQKSDQFVSFICAPGLI